MYQSIQFKTTTPPVRYSTSRSPLRRGFLLIWLVLACFALSPPARAQLPNIFAADDPSGSLNSGGANIAYLQNTTGSDVTLTLDGNTIITKANRLNIFDRSSGTWVEKVILNKQSQPISIAGGSTLLTGLRAYYALSDLTDSSGNGLTLINHNSVTLVTGKVGNAANFVSASSQYLSHADATQYQMGTGSFTLAAWIKIGSTLDQNIVSYGTDSFGYSLFQNGGALIVRIGDGTFGKNAGGQFNHNNGNWHLVVGTADRTNNILTCYIDNVSENPQSIATVTGSTNTATGGFQIGALDAAFFLDGTVDEVGLWNRVLTSTEISHLWNGGAGTTYPFTGL